MGGLPDGRGVVLLTGARGLIGEAATRRLEGDGWAVRGFDLVDGHDLRDEAAVLAAAAGCTAVVHAGALPSDDAGSPSDIVATNVLGTWHVLLAAEAHRMARVVAFSSVRVRRGFSQGEGEPASHPVDDDHPRRASRPYGMSKHLTEDMCESWTARTEIPSIMLRPVETIGEPRFSRLDPARQELGSYVHVDDVAAAIAAALIVPIEGHVRLTLSAGGDYDTSRARSVLGWQAVRHPPRRRFRRLARRALR